MFMQQADTLTGEEEDHLQHLRADEQTADLHDLIQTYCRMNRDRDVACLAVWLGAARSSSFRELRGFAEHLQQYYTPRRERTISG
jgi:hypothetical protein